MKLIRPNAELWEQGYTMNDIWKHIAKCTRVCYQSTPKKENEDDEDFVRRVIFRNKPDWSEANHLAMLEHGTVYLFVPAEAYNEYEICSFYKQNKYSIMICKEKSKNYINHYITTNLRVLVENNRMRDLEYLCDPTIHHEHRYTICFTTNIGVSREFNRHRVNSIAEESTRFCNYNKKNDGQITSVLPTWLLTEENLPYIESHQNDELSSYCQEYLNGNNDINPECWDDMDFYLFALKVSEYCYNMLIKKGWIPQQAREVLPLATKTQLIHTAFGSDWQHFIKLRSEGVSGAPHPNAKVLGDMVKKLLNGKTI